MKKAASQFGLFLMSLILVATLNMKSSEAAEVYKIDNEHSSITFKVRHLVAKTKGTFNKFNGEITFDENKPKNSKVNATINVKSVDTGVKKRDEHLRGKDFFNVAKYPKMTFETVKVTKVKRKKKAELVGKLTLHGITKPVILDVELNGIGEDPWGNKRIGFTGTTTINRKDFDITWNLEGKDGDLVLGEEVEITLEIEGIKKS